MSLESVNAATSVLYDRSQNQAAGIGQFAVDFMSGKWSAGPSDLVRKRTKMFHSDAYLCGLSALALRTNAPTILRSEALTYPDPSGATVFGALQRVKAEKAIAANSAAVREWDSNGTNFGYNPALGHTAGEFGHNDFYPVAIAACQETGADGNRALMAMMLLDEIRGRLAEVFSLKTYKIDHVVHGAIGSAATYGAVHGATPEQIEHAIGMFVAHYIPWRAIRAGKQLSDSKGSSAAISSEVAVLSMKRAMQGFIGPKDIFRNPESMFRQFEPTNGDSPFDLAFSHSGDDFAVMGMHFKLGLYEHQSAGALQGTLDCLLKDSTLVERLAASSRGEAGIGKIRIVAYEPAFGIIGDPAKRDPKTRQSADHSMVYIVSTLLRKAIEVYEADPNALKVSHTDELWRKLMLLPYDYSEQAVFHPVTRRLMELIEFAHGGPAYDEKYPDGIPTSIVFETTGGNVDSGFVLHPSGHARNKTANLEAILDHKFESLGALSTSDSGALRDVLARLSSLETLSAKELLEIYQVPIAYRDDFS